MKKLLLLSFLILSIAHQNFGQVPELLSFNKTAAVKGQLGTLDMDLNSITLSGTDYFATGALYDATQTEELMSIFFSVSASKDVIVNLGYPSGSNMASHLDPNTNYKIIVPQGTVRDFNNVSNSWPATDLALDYTTGSDNVAPSISFAAVNQTFDGTENEWEVARDFTGPYLLIADEAVTITSGASITFTNQVDNSIQYTIPLNSDNVTIQTPQNVTLPTTVIGITLDELLYAEGLSTLYEVELSPGALTDGTNVQAPAVFNVLQFKNVPGNPSIFYNSVDNRENLPPYRIIGTFETGSGGIAESDLEWILLDNTSYPDNQFFYVSGSSLATNISFDYESKISYSIGIRVGLPGGPTKDFEATIGVLNSSTETLVVNALTPISSEFAPPAGNPIRREFSIEFNSEAVAGSGTLNLYRQDDNSLVETLTVGTSSNIIFDGNLVKLFPNTALDASTGYYWEIDNGAVRNWSGFSTSTDWEFVTGAGPVTAAGPYRVNLSNTSVEENQFAGAFIGTLTTDNFSAGATHTYVFAETGTTTNGNFSLLENPFTSAWSLSANSALDFEGQKEYSLNITSSDGTRSFTQGFTISVTNTVNEPPTDITFNPNILVEDKPIGELAGTLSATDPEGQAVTYTLPGTTFDNELFSVTNSNEVVTTQVLSTSTKQDYEIYVRVEDADGYFFYETFYISLMPDFSGGGSVTESTQTINFPVIPDQLDSYTYTLNASSDAGLEIGYSIVDGPGYIQEGNQLKFSNGGTVTVAADQPGNFVFSAAAQVTRTFTVAAVPPVGESVIPVDEANFAYLEKAFYINFNEDVQLGTGTISLFLANGTLVEEIPVSPTNTDPRVYIHANQRAFYYNFDTVLEELTAYYVTITAGAVEDLIGNDYAGLGIGDLDFTTNARPKLDIQSPAHEATDVSVNPTIEFSFEEDIDVLEVGTEIALREYDTDNLVESFDIYTDRGSNGFDGFIDATQTISITPSVSLLENTKYYLRVEPAEALQEIEYFRQFDTKDGWTFTTEDTTPPTVSSLSPLDDATGVSVDANFTVTFNENVTIPVENQAIIVYRNGGAEFIMPHDDSRLTVNGNTLIIDLGITLETETNYGIWLKGVADESGNYFVSPGTYSYWSFTTEAAAADTDPPTVISFSPADDATGVALDGNLAVTFNETIQASTGAIEVRKVSDNSIVISGNATDDTQIFSISGATLSIDLGNYNTNAPEAETAYYVQLFDNAISDASGNPFANGFSDNATWSFTTGAAVDVTPPSIISLSPADDATNVSINSILTVEFNEPIALAESNQAVAVYRNGQPDYLMANDDSRLSINGSSLSIDLGTLDNSTPYYVWLRDVTDLAGNYYAQNDISGTWNFTTRAPNSAPTGIALSPTSIDENNAVNDIIGTLSTTDADAADTHTYELVAGTGDTDNGSFNIVDDELKAVEVFDFETKSSYSVRVQTDDSNGGTFQKAFTITVNDVQLDQTITFTEIPDKTFGDAPFELDATTVPSGRAITYEVSSGPATVSGSTLTITGAGTVLVEALQAGGDDYNAVSASQEFLVGKAEQIVTFADIADQNLSDGSVALNATASSGLDVTFTLEAGDGSINGNTLTFNSGGTFTVIATQAGNDNYNAATATTQSFVVNDATKDSQTITFEAMTNKTFGDASFTLTASSDSELAVSFEVVNGPVSLNGNEVTITGTGTASIRATQGGNDTYNPAEPVDQSFDITKADLMVSADDKIMTYGETLPTLTYQIEGFVYSDEESDLSTAVEISTTADQNSNAGTYDITVSGATAVNYDLSFEAGTLTIEKAAQEITFGPIADVDIDQSSELNLSATTSSSLAVSFEVVSGPATLNGNTLSLTGTGEVTIRANQAGNENFEAAEAVTQSFNVTSSSKADQTITFDALEAKTFGDAPFELTATASSDLAVTYTSSDEAVAIIDGTTVTIVGAGTTTIMASQEGNADFNPAPAINQALVVNQADQEITIESISDKDIDAADFEVVASTTSELELMYTILSGPATINGNLISLTGEVGTVEIEVSQAGNENYNAASATGSFDVVDDPCQGFAATASLIQNVSCSGEEDGSFEISTSNGTAPFTFSIGNDSQDNGLFENRSAGGYEITVTDANGCTAIASIEISEPEAIEVTAEITDSNSINGNGSITLTVTGGSGNFTYDWSNGETAANLSDLEIGEYSVIVTDEAGCSIAESYTIGGVTATSEAFELNIYPNPVINQVQVIHGENVNQITLIDANGKIITQQKTEGKQTQLEMKTLPAGMYFIRLDDGKMKRIIKE